MRQRPNRTRRAADSLAEHGIVTVAQLAAADASVLVAEFGPRMGPWYQTLGRGEGARVVDDSPWVARGHSRETTYQQNLTDPAQIEDAVRELAAQVLDDVAAEGRPVIGLTLKVRYDDFSTVTRSLTTPGGVQDTHTIATHAQQLLDRTDAAVRPVRLLGVSVHNLVDPSAAFLAGDGRLPFDEDTAAE